ncbi:hypothetical protein VP01_2722g3 [Puccinia sorghi]|uniref:Uncharacterized protein n=1 Tax=Puccinia sorghi TaxID=27349 RepID=A0A0L6V3E1_9BASI|nr:hypothetical protein VP01_2722g3 [Puccinia sorghi]
MITRKAEEKQTKESIVNLDNFFLDYTQGTLAFLGLHIWGPDLDDSPQSLYNKACRQAALKSFRQAAAGGAYAYMNISKKYAKALELLIPTYNHYVHFLQKQRYEREKKQVGKFYEDEERKVIGRARDKVNAHLKFSLAQKLPKRYQKIISNLSSHSNNEYDSKKGLNIIKTLKFQSENATKFFHHLDAAIRKQEPAVPSKPSLFPKPPRDFRLISLIPLAEKLLDKQFTKHYFDKLLNHITSLIKLKMRRIHQTLRMIAAIEPDDDDFENLKNPDDAMECADKDIAYDEDQVQRVGDSEDDEEEARKQRYNAMILDEDPEW